LIVVSSTIDLLSEASVNIECNFTSSDGKTLLGLFDAEASVNIECNFTSSDGKTLLGLFDANDVSVSI
jgi:hypothetical protein